MALSLSKVRTWQVMGAIPVEKRMLTADGKWRRRAAYVALTMGAIWTILPLYWMGITAFKSFDEMHLPAPTLVPQTFVATGFIEAWTYGGAHGIQDSLIIALGTLSLALLVGFPAAYSLSRFKTGGPNLAFAILAFRFLSPIALAGVIFTIGARLRIVDTHLLVILANAIFQVPFVVWVMMRFIDDIPYEIEEAAYMDGAGWWRTMRDHVLPLAVPGLVSVALFVLVFTWNEFIFATLLTGNRVVPFTRVIPGLQFGKKYLLVQNWPAVSALGVLVLLVVVALGFYLQRHIARAMTYGAVSNE